MKALITGASSGMGKDMAVELAKKGYDVILVARNEERLKKLQSEINKLNVRADIIVKDLSTQENCKELFNQAKDVDILINNAGFGDYGFFKDTDLEKELTMINTNIVAVHILTKLYLKEMCKKNSGKILNVASIAGTMPGPLMATYYATKSYVVRLTEGIREELRKQKSNVKVSVLMPGPVQTNFFVTAGVNFGINALDSKYVAKYTISRFLKGKFYIVPGFLIRCTRFFAKIIPSRIIAKFAYYVQKNKKSLDFK